MPPFPQLPRPPQSLLEAAPAHLLRRECSPPEDCNSTLTAAIVASIVAAVLFIVAFAAHSLRHFLRKRRTALDPPKPHHKRKEGHHHAGGEDGGEGGDGVLTAAGGGGGIDGEGGDGGVAAGSSSGGDISPMRGKAMDLPHAETTITPRIEVSTEDEGRDGAPPVFITTGLFGPGHHRHHHSGSGDYGEGGDDRIEGLSPGGLEGKCENGGLKKPCSPGGTGSSLERSTIAVTEPPSASGSAVSQRQWEKSPAPVGGDFRLLSPGGCREGRHSASHGHGGHDVPVLRVAVPHGQEGVIEEVGERGMGGERGEEG